MSLSLADALRALFPPEAYDLAGPALSAELEATANVQQGVVDSAAVVANAMHPSTADLPAIASWERVLALTPLPNATPENRVQAVLAKLGELGGLSRSYFVRLAASQGYGISISEPRAFRVGISRCGDRLYGEDVVFLWLVTINSRPPGGDDAALQALFDDLKPAHTLCQFVSE